MKKNLLCILVLMIVLSSCELINYERIKGNGKASTEQRNVGRATRIKSLGSFDVKLIQGTTAGIKIEADANLIPYIVTEEEDGYLVVKTKDHVNLSSENPIRIYITTDKLEELEVAGSSDITGEGKFAGADHLKLSIAGSGNITLDVNTPDIEASIAGSGDISLTGETKDAKIEIAGDGSYKAENLKSENVSVSIAGSGDVKVFADNTLKVDIAGSGDIYYKGNATITKSIAGSGTIKPLP